MFVGSVPTFLNRKAVKFARYQQRGVRMVQISECFPHIRHHSSSVGRNILHMSFKVKFCHKVFSDKKLEERCGYIFREVSDRNRWLLREIGFDVDHVHITIEAGTKGPENVAKALKGNSGRKLLNEFPNLKKKYFWGSGFWSPAIYFDSIGERTLADMDSYVRNQGLQHKSPIMREQSKLDDFAT